MRAALFLCNAGNAVRTKYEEHRNDSNPQLNFLVGVSQEQDYPIAMKRGEILRDGLPTVPQLLFFAATLVLVTNRSVASTALSPYTCIVERNSFGLKPPVNPADLVKPPPPVTADIKLQGITTILGRKQVLMKIKVPARPPEPAREQSFVFVEGQREGEVEVKEINPAEGTVKIDNGGTILALNMKDHGEKPTPGAAPAAPNLPAPGVMPGIPPPAAVVPTAAAPTTTVETFGGNKTIPTRTLRSGNEGTFAAGGVPGSSTTPGASPNNAETAAALYIVNQAKNEQLRQSGVSIPKMPQHPFLKNESPGQ